MSELPSGYEGSGHDSMAPGLWIPGGLTEQVKAVTLWVPREGQEAKRTEAARKVKLLKKLKSFGFE